MMPISSNPSIVEAINGTVQISASREMKTIGLLVERDRLFGGVLLTTAQAQELARLLSEGARLNEQAGT